MAGNYVIVADFCDRAGPFLKFEKTVKALKNFTAVSYFLQFSFYCNMQLTQFNIYFNHDVHIFMLSYITRYSHFRKCE